VPSFPRTSFSYYSFSQLDRTYVENTLAYLLVSFIVVAFSFGLALLASSSPDAFDSCSARLAFFQAIIHSCSSVESELRVPIEKTSKSESALARRTSHSFPHAFNWLSFQPCLRLLLECGPMLHSNLGRHREKLSILDAAFKLILPSFGTASSTLPPSFLVWSLAARLTCPLLPV
jgi:hypothetical protein